MLVRPVSNAGCYTYTERARCMSEHRLGGKLASVKTMFIAHKDSLQPKVAALARLLSQRQ